MKIISLFVVISSLVCADVSQAATAENVAGKKMSHRLRTSLKQEPDNVFSIRGSCAPSAGCTHNTGSDTGCLDTSKGKEAADELLACIVSPEMIDTCAYSLAMECSKAHEQLVTGLKTVPAAKVKTRFTFERFGNEPSGYQGYQCITNYSTAYTPDGLLIHWDNSQDSVVGTYSHRDDNREIAVKLGTLPLVCKVNEPYLNAKAPSLHIARELEQVRVAKAAADAAANAKADAEAAAAAAAAKAAAKEKVNAAARGPMLESLKKVTTPKSKPMRSNPAE